MSAKQKKSIIQRLRTRFRLVMLNDNTFEEKISLKFTALNVFIFIGFLTILLIFAVASLIAFTPIREYLPGYADEVKMKRQLISISLKADSMELELNQKNFYLENITNILSGKISPDSALALKPDTTKKYKNITIKRSEADSELRHAIEEQEKYSIQKPSITKKESGINNFFFFSPIRGYITSSFNLSEGHFGIDVAAKENESIKSTLDGTVISAAWSHDNGNVIQVQHNNNVLSIYKHCSALLKKTGQHVKAGEVIAIVGNTGELSHGPHLHFELWYNGSPVDPQEYMSF